MRPADSFLGAGGRWSTPLQSMAFAFFARTMRSTFSTESRLETVTDLKSRMPPELAFPFAIHLSVAFPNVICYSKTGVNYQGPNLIVEKFGVAGIEEHHANDFVFPFSANWDRKP